MENKKYKDVDKNIGMKIRIERLRKEMTIRELAKKIGVNYCQLQKYEKGKNKVCTAKLYTIADVLGIPVTSFFDKQIGINEVEKYDKKTLTIINNFKKLSGKQINCISSVVKFFIKKEE